MNAIVLGVNLTQGAPFDEVSKYRSEGYEVVQRNIVIQGSDIYAVYWLEYPAAKEADDGEQEIRYNVHFDWDGTSRAASDILTGLEASIRRRRELLQPSPGSIRDVAATDKLQRPDHLPDGTSHDTGHTPTA